MGSIALLYYHVGAGLISGLCLLVHTCPSVFACVVQAQWNSVCACLYDRMLHSETLCGGYRTLAAACFDTYRV